MTCMIKPYQQENFKFEQKSYLPLNFKNIPEMSGKGVKNGGEEDGEGK